MAAHLTDPELQSVTTVTVVSAVASDSVNGNPASATPLQGSSGEAGYPTQGRRLSHALSDELEDKLPLGCCSKEDAGSNRDDRDLSSCR